MRPHHVVLFKQKTAYGVRISDWSSDVCSSDLVLRLVRRRLERPTAVAEKAAEEWRGWDVGRSEERRVGKECVSTCGSRWSPYLYKKNIRPHSREVSRLGGNKVGKSSFYKFRI